MNIDRKPVYGTSRQRVILDDGKALERQFAYMNPSTWANLKKLASLQGTSGSKVIERLIGLATTFHPVKMPSSK